VRGGNKHRLIARIWWHLGRNLAQINDEAAYLVFRTKNETRTFAQLHADFDYILPTQWRAAVVAPAGAPAAAPAPRAITVKATKLQASFARTADLGPAERAWIEAQGGVAALDQCRMALPNGRTFPVLDTSWFTTAQAVRKLMAGTNTLLR
jgi:hypothetical protein